MLKPSASPLTDVQDRWIVAKNLIPQKTEKVKFLFTRSEARKTELRKTYERLMCRAQGRVKISGIHDRHHIIPKSMGGSNSEENLVYLTYKEHFLAHWLLATFTEGLFRRKMLHAMNQMMRVNKKHGRRTISGWHYDLARRAQREAMVGHSYNKGKIPSLKCREATRKRLLGHKNWVGSSHPSSKINDEIAVKIFTSFGTYEYIAKTLGTTAFVVEGVKRKRTWKHIHPISGWCYEHNYWLVQ